MSDGRVPGEDTVLELQVEKMLQELGYVTRKGRKVNIPAEWTSYDHGVLLQPDRVVHAQVRGNEVSKAVLADGHHYHDRTLRQQERDARHDRWYNMAGYYVVHVGSYWFTNERRKEELRPLLKVALLSSDWVVDLAN